MSRASRTSHQQGDGLERQAAPQVRDDDFALFKRKVSQRRGSSFGIEGRSLGGVKPRGRPDGGGGFMMPSPASRSCGADGAVANHPVEPGQGVVRWPRQGRQLDEGFLNDVFRRGAPLTCVQHQCRRMPVHQLTEKFRSHHLHDAHGSDLSQVFPQRDSIRGRRRSAREGSPRCSGARRAVTSTHLLLGGS